MALQGADPKVSLAVMTDSEHVIKHFCYWAAKNNELGWSCTNGDLLRDAVYLLQVRSAPVRFVWVEAHAGNSHNEMADGLAKAGAKLPPPAVHVPAVTFSARPATPVCETMPLAKVYTSLPQVALPHPKCTEMRVEDETHIPDAHRGRNKIRMLQEQKRHNLLKCETAAQFWNLIRSWTDARPIETEVTLQELTAEMKMRMNAVLELPTGFNLTQLHMDSALAALLPKNSVDHSPDKLFSRPFSLDEIADAKSHIKKRSTDTALGIDGFGYNDILAIPNENIQGLVQACMDRKDVPTQWLASLIIGIAKKGKDPTKVSSYRLIALECCLLKFTTLLIDLRIRCYTDLNNVIPESQNGFCTGFRTNNNPLILRAMSERAAQQGEPLYVAYIDLRNAFPATNRPTLWVKLNALGISGRIIDWLKMLYDKMAYMVKLNGKLSESFLSDLGVLTGDTLSPTLWNLG